MRRAAYAQGSSYIIQFHANSGESLLINKDSLAFYFALPRKV